MSGGVSCARPSAPCPRVRYNASVTKLSKSAVTVLYDETANWHECSETIKLPELSSKRLKVTKLVE